MLIENIYDAKKSKHIPSNSLPPSSQGHEFNINFWMFISDYTYEYGKTKIIFNRSINDINAFTVQLDSKTNSLTISVSTMLPLQNTDFESEHYRLQVELQVELQVALQVGLQVALQVGLQVALQMVYLHHIQKK